MFDCFYGRYLGTSSLSGHWAMCPRYITHLNYYTTFHSSFDQQLLGYISDLYISDLTVTVSSKHFLNPPEVILVLPIRPVYMIPVYRDVPVIRDVFHPGFIWSRYTGMSWLSTPEVSIKRKLIFVRINSIPTKVVSFCFHFWRFSLVRQRFKFHFTSSRCTGILRLHGQKFVSSQCTGYTAII